MIPYFNSWHLLIKLKVPMYFKSRLCRQFTFNALPSHTLVFLAAQKVIRSAACHNSHAKANSRRNSPVDLPPILSFARKVCSFRVTDFCLFSAASLRVADQSTVRGKWKCAMHGEHGASKLSPGQLLVTLILQWQNQI